ncbi:MAG: hypothetical protein ACK4VM_00310 [Bosea sp. (in: a-proteobacteria)]
MKSINDHPSTVIPWYVESEFAVFSNRRAGTAAQAYRTWRQRADEAIAIAQSQGYAVQLMPVRLAAFRDWLACERRRDDTESRRAFLVVCAASAGRLARHESDNSREVPTGRHGFQLH